MTTATAPAAGSFSGEELGRLLALMKESDSVVLKGTVPEAAHRSTAAALGMDPLEAQIRTVTFFDTPNLTLDRHGLVVRARRVQGKGGDSVIKLRPVVPSDLPADLRHSSAFRVEVDALPGGFVCSATLKGSAKSEEVQAANAGTLRLRKLYSKEQRAFFAEHAPPNVTLDDLSVLGPLFVLKLRLDPPDLGR